MTVAPEVLALVPTLASLPIAALIIGCDGIIRWANKRFESLIAHDFVEIAGQNIGVLASMGGLSLVQNWFRQSASGEPWEGESLWSQLDGATRAVGMAITPIKDSGGRITHSLLVITSRTPAEEDLLEKAERYSAIFSSMAEGVVFQAADGRIEACNERAERILGLTADQMAGRTSVDPRWAAVHEDESPFPGDTHPSMVTLRTGQALSDVVMGVHKPDGSLTWISINSRPLRRGGEPYAVVTTFVDITERKRIADEKAKLEAQFRQAQKMESVGRLAGGVAHDFNNLLTVIMGYSGAILNRLGVSDPLRQYAEEISKAGARAASLTNQLLTFSRRQTTAPRVLDLNATIRDSAPMLQRLIGEEIAIEMHLDELLGGVTADPDQIHQVIMNLVLNARDAMPDGGKLSIATANVDLDAERVAAIHSEMIAGEYVLVTVTDTGHGIDGAIRQQIFDPFFTTKEPGKGTGLGLSIVYGIVRQSGGWIDLWSEVGVGTSFQVYLPRVDRFLATEKNVNSARAGGSETILVVEDQEAVRSFVKDALQPYGYHVMDASNGEAAFAAAQEYPERIHLLLTDVVLPGMNGRHLADRLRALRPDLKVLFTSGYPNDVIAKHGVLEDGISYLPKPFSPEGLATKVREVLGDASKSADM